MKKNLILILMFFYTILIYKNNKTNNIEDLLKVIEFKEKEIESLNKDKNELAKKIAQQNDTIVLKENQLKDLDKMQLKYKAMISLINEYKAIFDRYSLLSKDQLNAFESNDHKTFEAFLIEQYGEIKNTSNNNENNVSLVNKKLTFMELLNNNFSKISTTISFCAILTFINSYLARTSEQKKLIEINRFKKNTNEEEEEKKTEN